MAKEPFDLRPFQKPLFSYIIEDRDGKEQKIEIDAIVALSILSSLVPSCFQTHESGTDENGNAILKTGIQIICESMVNGQKVPEHLPDIQTIAVSIRKCLRVPDHIAVQSCLLLLAHVVASTKEESAAKKEPPASPDSCTPTQDACATTT